MQKLALHSLVYMCIYKQLYTYPGKKQVESYINTYVHIYTYTFARIQV